MATEAHLIALKEELDNFKAINREKLLRQSLGDASMGLRLSPMLEELDSKVDFVEEYAPQVHNNYVKQFRVCLTEIRTQANAQTIRDMKEYIANSDVVIDAIEKQLEAIRLQWAHFIAAAVESKGFLNDGGIQKQYQESAASLESAAATTIERIQKEADAAIKNAQDLAEQIETKARRTATKISVEAVQKEFKSAVKPLAIQLGLWGLITVFLISVILVSINSYMDQMLPENWTWQLIYTSAIRLTYLIVLGSITTFCMRIFKSQLHMYQHNNHRIRVANSIEAFVESALTPEQRDLILTHLVDSVASFGNTGLLNTERDGVQTPTMTIDHITRSFSPPSN